MSIVRPAIVPACAWVLALTACRARSDGAPPASDGALGCAAACSAIAAVHCDGEGAEPDGVARCNTGCRERANLSRAANCTRLHEAYLKCVSRAPIDCRRARCSPGTCLEHATGVPACASEHAALSRCLGVCTRAGTTQLLNRQLAGEPTRVDQVELVAGGCAACPKASGRGAPSGSPCQAESVCEQHCCRCKGKLAHYLIRACIDSACASSKQSCELPVDRAALCD